LKKILAGALTIGLLAAVLQVTGCGAKTTPGKSGDQAQGAEEGNYTVSEQAPTEEQLGVPIYPGAQLVPGSGGVTTSGGSEGDVTNVGAIYETDDGLDEVVAWYTGKLGQPFSQTVTEIRETNWMITPNAALIIVVSVIDKSDRTSISINRMTREIGQ